jgi:hypothetical protein
LVNELQLSSPIVGKGRIDFFSFLQLVGKLRMVGGVVSGKIFPSVITIAFFLLQYGIKKIPTEIGIISGGFQHFHQEPFGGLVAKSQHVPFKKPHLLHRSGKLHGGILVVLFVRVAARLVTPDMVDLDLDQGISSNRLELNAIELE